jgi:hypothetical protein
LHSLFSSSLKSSLTDFWVFFFAVLRQNVYHCCPLILVQFTVLEDMFLRLQPFTTFALTLQLLFFIFGKINVCTKMAYTMPIRPSVVIHTHLHLVREVLTQYVRIFHQRTNTGRTGSRLKMESRNSLMIANILKILTDQLAMTQPGSYPSITSCLQTENGLCGYLTPECQPI